jgi:hypothetical protein
VVFLKMRGGNDAAGGLHLALKGRGRPSGGWRRCLMRRVNLQREGRGRYRLRPEGERREER